MLVEHVDGERKTVPAEPKEDGGFIALLRNTSVRAPPLAPLDEQHYDGWEQDAELAAEIEAWCACSAPSRDPIASSGVDVGCAVCAAEHLAGAQHSTYNSWGHDSQQASRHMQDTARDV